MTNVFKSIDIRGLGEKYSGKVRDCYVVGDKRILITTDRISSFDKNLGFIPYKGQVLNKLSKFWFKKTRDIIKNHMISTPDPNVMIGENAKGIPIEMVVRGYITGVTGTSIWGSYEKGERNIYGINFPDGLKKNQKLPSPVITPTTKAASGHDERLTRDEIVAKKIVSEKIWEQMSKVSLALFRFGQEICEKGGLILVDVKYEFGILNNQLILIDEMHTPDSSRLWLKDTYEERIEKSEEPENYDKEFIRLWYIERCNPYKDDLPEMSSELIKETSKRYIDVYERITGEKFVADQSDPEVRIRKNLQKEGILHA